MNRKKFNKNYYEIFKQDISQENSIIDELKSNEKENNNIRKKDANNYHYNKIIIKDNFRIIINIKKFIYYIKKTVLNFPNNEKVLKDKNIRTFLLCK